MDEDLKHALAISTLDRLEHAWVDAVLECCRVAGSGDELAIARARDARVAAYSAYSDLPRTLES